MVTFKEVYDLELSGTLQAEGCFVLPITWLYLMLKNNQLNIDEKLFDESNFTDELLVDILLDFRELSYRRFLESQFGHLVVIYNDWNIDRKWRAIKAVNDESTVKVVYKGKSNELSVINIDRMVGGSKLHPLLDYDNVTSAKINLAYANILHAYTKYVRFAGCKQCQKTIILR